MHLDELWEIVGEDSLRDLRLGYGSAQGLEYLRTEIGLLNDIPADYVVTTPGAAFALHLLAIEFCRPNDEVILFTPCFPPSRDTLIGAGVTVRELALQFDESYRINLDRFAALLTSRTKLVSLATPQNPSGIITSPEDVDALLAIMHRIAPEARLFVDETYRHAVYGNSPIPMSLAGRDPRIISAASLSKAFGAPGLRVGWITTADEQLRERLIIAKMNVVISGSPLNETLAAHLLAQQEIVLAPRRTMLAKALIILADWHLSESDRLDWVCPDAGALSCFRLRRDQYDNQMVQQFWTALPKYDLQLGPGSWFGEKNQIFRLGFGYLPLEKLPRALELISETMSNTQELQTT